MKGVERRRKPKKKEGEGDGREKGTGEGRHLTGEAQESWNEGLEGPHWRESAQLPVRCWSQPQPGESVVVFYGVSWCAETSSRGKWVQVPPLLLAHPSPRHGGGPREPAGVQDLGGQRPGYCQRGDVSLGQQQS